ncbi:hypothetical protein Tco_1372153 [Tanacetum coccineum]
MPSAVQNDQKDTVYYIPMHHHSNGLSRDEKSMFKHLEKRLFHEGRVIDPSYIGDSNVLELNKPIFKMLEVILSENVISLTGNKDHLNDCLVYMLYCLSTQKPFNLAYCMVKRMVGVIKKEKMVFPYGMLLTRLYRHVSTFQPCPLIDKHFLTPNVMVPLTARREKRLTVDEKRSQPSTSSSSSSES